MLALNPVGGQKEDVSIWDERGDGRYWRRSLGTLYLGQPQTSMSMHTWCWPCQSPVLAVWYFSKQPSRYLTGGCEDRARLSNDAAVKKIRSNAHEFWLFWRLNSISKTWLALWKLGSAVNILKLTKVLWPSMAYYIGLCNRPCHRCSKYNLSQKCGRKSLSSRNIFWMHRNEFHFKCAQVQAILCCLLTFM